MRFFKSCVGFKLFRLGKYQLELWICPPHKRIELHKHPNEHTYLYFIKGVDTVIFKKDGLAYREYKLKFPKVLSKIFYLSPSQYHGFEVGNKTLMFLNFQKWLIKPTSACEDFEPLQKELSL
jgi:hypothetical protein